MEVNTSNPSRRMERQVDTWVARPVRSFVSIKKVVSVQRMRAKVDHVCVHLLSHVDAQKVLLMPPFSALDSLLRVGPWGPSVTLSDVVSLVPV